MTTPNIKALAEQIKKNYEAQPDWAEHKIENVSYQLASALLRVLEDNKTLFEALDECAAEFRNSQTECREKKLPSVEIICGYDNALFKQVFSAVESHNKLMEELGGAPSASPTPPASP